MATPDEVLQVVEELIEDTQNPELSDRQLNQMCEGWIDVPVETLRAAARRHVNSSVFFPKLAEMNRLIEDEKKAGRTHLSVVNHDLDFEAELAEYDRIQREMEATRDWPTCSPCAGAGYVVRMPNGELITLSYWRNLTEHAVPCGEPTEDCPWEKCSLCAGAGKQQPESVGQLRAIYNNATSTETEKVRTA
jgi:hypothetical protein